MSVYIFISCVFVVSVSWCVLQHFAVKLLLYDPLYEKSWAVTVCFCFSFISYKVGHESLALVFRLHLLSCAGRTSFLHLLLSDEFYENVLDSFIVLEIRAYDVPEILKQPVSEIKS